MNGNYYVYMVSNWTGEVLYIGMTNDLERRVSEHKAKIQKGFTAKYNTIKLVYYEHTHDVNAAIAREKQLKKWRRDKKDFLVRTINPGWKDLSSGWGADPSASLGMTGKDAAP